MANKNIKGITIEIGGNTSKLQDALKGVNKVIYSTNSELKQLNQALKLDPKNTELLAQKQDVLQKNIQASTEKLNQLKEAQRQMGSYNSLTDEQKENYRALSVEIAKSENAIRSMNKELKNADNIDLSKLGESLKKVGKIAAEVIGVVTGVVTAVGSAIGKVIEKGIKSYAALEQNIGGVETLFKDNADKVVKNAQQAYKTAGVSANEYMEGVTSFAASLLQSTGNDTAKAADIADMAFRDMSDNANKFGTDMASIQHAYQGFAKQNYTMLDNLKLGYGGTKSEMERLLKDAQKLTGVKYDISNLSDVYNAIHAIQENLGVTGTTAKEAEETISGSMNSMKAAFDNFLNGSGGVEELGETIVNFLNNVAKAIKKNAPTSIKGLGELFKQVAPVIGDMVVELLPMLINAAQDLLSELINWLNNNVEQFTEMAVSVINSIIKFILENLPLLLEAAVKIIAQLAIGIAQALPDLIPTIVDCRLLIVETLIDNVDLLLDAAVEIIIGLSVGLIKALPKLLERLPEIIAKIVVKLIELAPKMVEASIKLITELGKGFIDNISKAFVYIVTLPGRIKDKIVEGVSAMWDAGKNLMQGLVDGLKQKWEDLKNGVANLGGAIVDKFKNVFGIHSPSKVMKEEIGVNLGLGLVEGIEDTQKQVNAAMSQLTSGINASVNPTINPTANSNPLIIQIEKFINNRESDIQQLAQELEFYRKETALAKGGN